MSVQVGWYLCFNKKSLRDYQKCNCLKAANYVENKVPGGYHSFSWYIIAYGIEKYSSEKKCLDFVYQKHEIEESSVKYLAKPLDVLTKEELINLILILKNPYLYERRPERISEELIKS